MPDSLRDALNDIRAKLAAGVYQDKERVRLSLVARAPMALRWIAE